MKTLQLNSEANRELKHLAKTLKRNGRGRSRRVAPLAVTMAAVFLATACGHAMMLVRGSGLKPPAAAEFGPGPRPSANHLYVATLETTGELRLRKMQTVRVTIADRDGNPVEGATLAIDGGMPQHGHGLPTKPRMTRVVRAGTYEIDGVRFNMGGWWEFKVAITSDRGTDTVTFNLGL